MVHWKEVLTQMTPDADRRMAELRGRLDSQLGGVGPLKIITFRGYGTPERLFLRGRVIEENVFLASEKDDRVWDNLVHIYTHSKSRRVPNARLAARFQNVEQILTTDEEGYFEIYLKPNRPLVENRIWHPVELHLISPIPDIQSRYPIKATGQVIVPPAGARCGIISIIDSTLPFSDPTNLNYLARSAFLRTPHARLPFPGEAALYQAFYGGQSGAEMNPIFYLSSGSSELYDLLVQQMNLQSMPSGPVLFTRSNPGSRIRRILEFFPQLPFVLIGDAAEKDAEIFTDLACEFSGRIPAIYLRMAETNPGRAEQIRALAVRAGQSGSRLVLAENGLALGRLAASQGLLSPGMLAAIAENMQKDECPPSPLEALLNETSETHAWPVKITRQAVKKGENAPGTGDAAACQAQASPLRRSGKGNK